jgi:uncharacterized membrane protein YkgB
MKTLDGTVFIDTDSEPADAVRADVVYELDRRTIAFSARVYPVVTRTALFVVFFWFGIVKLMGHSEAAGLALALATKTVGASHFHMMFDTLAIVECVIGILCLVPQAVRLVVAMLFVHMTIVCAPLVLVPELTWQRLLVPTLIGQYIIKNVLVVAAALGLLAHASPLDLRGAVQPTE